jgi:Na+-transporting NADH:ubiquinone oxidoreductase subunit F
MANIVLAMGVTTAVFVGLSVLLLVAERYLANYGVCSISVNEGSTVFDVEGGGTLLAALYENKIFIPSACGGKGSCGYCKVTVRGGGGPLLPTETPFMSRPEVRGGVRLACQVKVKENLEILLPEDLLNVKEFQTRVADVQELTYDMREVTLDLIEPQTIKQRPGQYIQILAPGPDGDVFRAYSISSPSQVTDKVQIVVRLVPGGIASTYIHGLQVGDPVIFTGPFGEFHLAEDPEVDVICVGGGAGMAPMKNIIYSIYANWPERRCTLYFGCRSGRDVFYLKQYQELAERYPNFEVIYALSDPLEDADLWAGDTGFIHLSVDKRFKPGKKTQAFLCGPPPMIDAVMEVLHDKGLGDADIFYDKF